MTVAELMDQLALEDPEREITMEDIDGWRYDFQIADDEHLTISPLMDTKYTND